MGYYEDQELLAAETRYELKPYHTNTTAAGREQKPAYTRVYKDVAFDMFQNPMNRDLGKKRGNPSIKQAIKAIILTSNYERPYQPQIGTRIKWLLFEQMDLVTEELLKSEIKSALARNESERMTVQEVIVTPQYEQNSYAVKIVFTTKSTPDPDQVVITLQKTSGELSDYLFGG